MNCIVEYNRALTYSTVIQYSNKRNGTLILAAEEQKQKQIDAKIIERFDARRFGVVMTPLSRVKKILQSEYLSRLELKFTSVLNRWLNKHFSAN